MSGRILAAKPFPVQRRSLAEVDKPSFCEGCGKRLRQVYLEDAQKMSARRYCSEQCRKEVMIAVGRRFAAETAERAQRLAQEQAALVAARQALIGDYRYRDDPQAIRDHGSPGTVTRPATEVLRASTIYAGPQ